MIAARVAVWTLLLAVVTAQAGLVPRPRQVVRGEGEVALVGGVRAEPALASQAAALRGALERCGASFAEERGATVTLALDEAAGDGEAYRVTCRADGVVVSASTAAGVARGCATVLQLVEVVDGVASLPQVEIRDEPALGFRGFMVDMGRNPHGPEVLRQVVDACWFYKVNFLQLHLTDDQLFSWPSRAFPALLDERSGWTWDAFVELEAYARARGVAIIPEIDVPAHSTILRQRYPDVFGASPAELATRPEATAGMQTLLAELMEVFGSSPYVHIGGDEAYGVPQDDQRDFVNRLARFVKRQGRRAIAWEGPRLGEGEHKVDADVLHVNWRTTDFPAQQMLDAGYEVVHAAWGPDVHRRSLPAHDVHGRARGDVLRVGPAGVQARQPRDADVRAAPPDADGRRHRRLPDALVGRSRPQPHEALRAAPRRGRRAGVERRRRA